MSLSLVLLLSAFFMFALVDGLRHRQIRGDAGALRVKVYYINMDDNTQRNSCLKSQLNNFAKNAWSHGLQIVTERFSAATFSDKCVDTASCIHDQPSCFPSGRGFASHGGDMSDGEKDKARVLRGVFGDACSHYKVLRKMMEELKQFDYFLVLEDDVGIDNGISENLAKLFSHFPNFWSMITIDSFMWPARRTPPGDVIPSHIRKGLPLGGISPTKSTNWGSQAWLFNSKNVPLFVRFYESLPTMNVDWYTKVPRPLHLGIWSFTPGQLQQMRFVSKDLQSRLPASCGGEGVIKSDIGEMVPSETDVFLEMPLPESSSPRELLIFGMEGSGADWVQALVHETIEKPQGVVLCDWKAGIGCGGMPVGASPLLWDGKLSQHRSRSARSLSDAVAVVVVRHPFAVAEQLRQLSGETANSSVLCTGGRCSQKCKSDAGYAGLWSMVPCQWSSYAQALSSISGSGPFHQILVLRFEDTWEYPDRAVTEIAKLVGAGQPAPVTHAQVHAAAGGLLMSSLDYMTTAECNKLDDLCKNTDQGYLWQYGYHGCQLYYGDYTDQVSHESGAEQSYFMNCESFNDSWIYW